MPRKKKSNLKVKSRQIQLPADKDEDNEDTPVEVCSLVLIFSACILPFLYIAI